MPRVVDIGFDKNFPQRRDGLVAVVRGQLQGDGQVLTEAAMWLDETWTQSAVGTSLTERALEWRRRSNGSPSGNRASARPKVEPFQLPGDQLRADRLEHAIRWLLGKNQGHGVLRLLGGNQSKTVLRQNALRVVLVGSCIIDPDAGEWLGAITALASAPWEPSQAAGKARVRGRSEVCRLFGHDAMALMEEAMGVLGWNLHEEPEGSIPVDRPVASSPIATTNYPTCGAFLLAAITGFDDECRETAIGWVSDVNQARRIASELERWAWKRRPSVHKVPRRRSGPKSGATALPPIEEFREALRNQKPEPRTPQQLLADVYGVEAVSVGFPGSDRPEEYPGTYAAQIGLLDSTPSTTPEHLLRARFRDLWPNIIQPPAAAQIEIKRELSVQPSPKVAIERPDFVLTTDLRATSDPLWCSLATFRRMLMEGGSYPPMKWFALIVEIRDGANEAGLRPHFGSAKWIAPTIKEAREAEVDMGFETEPDGESRIVLVEYGPCGSVHVCDFSKDFRTSDANSNFHARTNAIQWAEGWMNARQRQLCDTGSLLKEFRELKDTIADNALGRQPRKWTWEQARDAMLAHLKHNPWPGMRAWEDILPGCGYGTLDKAVKRTHSLLVMKEAASAAKASTRKKRDVFTVSLSPEGQVGLRSPDPGPDEIEETDDWMYLMDECQTEDEIAKLKAMSPKQKRDLLAELAANPAWRSARASARGPANPRKRR